MFTAFMYNKNIRNVLYVIVFFAIVLPTCLLVYNGYNSITNFFNGESTTEKIARLNTNNKVLKDAIEATKKKVIFVKKKNIITNKVIATKVAKTISLTKTMARVKHRLKVKVVEATKHINKTIPEQKIVTINDKKVYKEVGNALMDSLYSAYDTVNKKDK